LFAAQIALAMRPRFLRGYKNADRIANRNRTAFFRIGDHAAFFHRDFRKNESFARVMAFNHFCGIFARMIFKIDDHGCPRRKHQSR